MVRAPALPPPPLTARAAKDLIRKLLTVDPKQRLDTKGALAHPWIGGNQASSIDIHATVKDQLIKFNARGKLRAAIKTVALVNRLKRMGVAGNAPAEGAEGAAEDDDSGEDF